MIIKKLELNLLTLFFKNIYKSEQIVSFVHFIN